MTEHNPNCNWEKTTKDQCEYRETHHYCPHPEHVCNCETMPPSNDKVAEEIEHTGFDDEERNAGYSWYEKNKEAFKTEAKDLLKRLEDNP